MIATNLPTVKVHHSITAAAEIGDIIKAPFVPVMRVIGKKCTEAKCHLLVAPIAATCQAEEWVIPLDAQTEAQQELTKYLEEQAAAATREEPEIEVDADPYSQTYRVWKGMQLIGTFYRSPAADEKWVAKPVGLGTRKRYPTEEAAKFAIVKAWGRRHG